MELGLSSPPISPSRSPGQRSFDLLYSRDVRTILLDRPSSKTTIDRFVGQSIGFLISLTRYMHNSIAAKSLQSRGNCIEKRPKPRVPHPILTVKLLYDQFGVEEDPELTEFESLGRVQPGDKGLILGLVVGCVP